MLVWPLTAVYIFKSILSIFLSSIYHISPGPKLFHTTPRVGRSFEEQPTFVCSYFVAHFTAFIDCPLTLDGIHQQL